MDDQDTFDAQCQQQAEEEARQLEEARLTLLSDRLAYDAWLSQVERELNRRVGRTRP